MCPTCLLSSRSARPPRSHLEKVKCLLRTPLYTVGNLHQVQSKCTVYQKKNLREMLVLYCMAFTVNAELPAASRSSCLFAFELLGKCALFFCPLCPAEAQRHTFGAGSQDQYPLISTGERVLCSEGLPLSFCFFLSQKKAFFWPGSTWHKRAETFLLSADNLWCQLALTPRRQTGGEY